MPIRVRLSARTKEIAPGLSVRRLLPAAASRTVGPFVFFDHFGPLTARPGDDHDVRPHPHIGLATVTYLFEGAMIHRDSLGSVQRIEPGAINWMSAGSGIVHSERTPPELIQRERRSHGLQLWVGLPATDEEGAPSFAHTPASDLPTWSDGTTAARVLIGALHGQRSPVDTFSPTLYLDVSTKAGGTFRLPSGFGDGPAERAVYPVEGALEIDGQRVEPGTLAVLETGPEAAILASAGARYVVIGGDPLDGHRHMWWNFVSSRRERIEAAKQAWASQSMGTIPGETEWVPLPD